MKKICVFCGEVETFLSMCSACGDAANARVVRTEIQISRETFDLWHQFYSGDTLMNDKARGLVTYGSKRYVITGSGGGHLDAHEVVSAKRFAGPTYKYSELTAVNGSGGPFHSNNQLFTCYGGAWVILPDQITLFVADEAQPISQARLF